MRSTILAGAMLLAGLQQSAAQSSGSPAPSSGPGFVAVTTLFPGGGSPPPPDPRAQTVEGNAEAISQGSRLFDWYNCSGCHFHGAGGIGPSLMDSQWFYGNKLDQIFASIDQGRPNGMPSWHGKIPASQIWDIAAYVKSLSASSPPPGTGQTTP